MPSVGKTLYVKDRRAWRAGLAAVTPGVWKYWQSMPEGYRRVRVAYIESQKKHGREQHQRALHNLVTKTAQNKRIGFRT